MAETIPDNLPYTPPGIECLRYGARRGGAGIGCCAVDVFQGFSNPPQAECPPIPLIEGDTRLPITRDGSQLYVSGTNEEVFLSYLVHGTFTEEPVQDHAFLAIITDEQLNSDEGQEWLRILKREGFEWVGSTSNSVYSEYHPNHIFLLIRTTGEYVDEAEKERLKRPPEGWETLPEPAKTPEELFYSRQELLTRTLKVLEN